ncbi:MAG: PD-(D/E)XK nuclease family protein [Candidatus Dormibacteria bacterium]
MGLIHTSLVPGDQADAWVADRVRARPNPLSPLTFIVPTLHSGRALRRGLAPIGYANVRSAIAAQVAESLGAASLAARGLSPTTPATQDAAIRNAIEVEAMVFGITARHPATVRTLRRLFQRFRDLELSAPDLDRIAISGEMARASVAVYRRFREVTQGANLYDRTDLFLSAIDTLPTTGSLLAEWGELVLWYPTDLSSPARRFIAAIAEDRDLALVLSPSSSPQVRDHFARQWQIQPDHLPRPNTPRLVVALDAADEATAVAREVIAGMDDGVRLDRIAVVYRESDLYGSLLRDTLVRAGLPYSGLDGRPLSLSLPGKALLALLRMRQRNFDRPSVVEFHGLVPHGHGDEISVADWERLSRKAGVVAGAAVWQTRFGRLRDETNDQLREIRGEADPSAARISRLERQLVVIENIVRRMKKLVDRINPPEPVSWGALCQWASKLFDEFVVAQREWDERDSEARELIASEISGLRAAGPLESAAALGPFIDSLTEVLESRTQTEGRLGIGVVVGPISSIAAMSFDRVYVLGVTEQSFPAAPPADPVLPLGEESDLLGNRARHQALERLYFESALMAAGDGKVTLTFPRWDAGSRPVYPSAWMVDLASAQSGEILRSGNLRAPVAGKSPVADSRDLGSARAALNLADFRLLNAPIGAALATSSLAIRTDLPLGRNLEAWAARRSTDLTEYDGCLDDASESSQRIRDGLSNMRISPTAIEQWAACPFKYFLGRWLRVEPTELPEDAQDWSLSPLDKGSLVHTVLERFFADMVSANQMMPGYAYTEADIADLERIADEEIAKLEGQGKTGLLLAWENERAVLLQDLRTFLEKDEAERGDGYVPRFLEQPFGFESPDSWPPLAVTVADGRQVELRGRIDRIDVQEGNGGFERLKVLDYKTGRAGKEPAEDDRLAAGKQLQLAAYTRAAETWLASQGLSATEVQAAYWYISRKGEFTFVRTRLDDGLREKFDEAVQIVDESIRSGCFPQVPGGETMRPGKTSWDNCIYCEYDHICPAGRDQLYERKREDPISALHARLAPELRAE